MELRRYWNIVWRYLPIVIGLPLIVGHEAQPLSQAGPAEAAAAGAEPAGAAWPAHGLSEEAAGAFQPGAWALAVGALRGRALIGSAVTFSPRMIAG